MKESICWSLICILISGCAPAPKDIPGIAKDHPANKFYYRAYGSVISDKNCRECQGNPNIPMGEIPKGEKYIKTEDLAPGVFRFREKANGKTYLGVSYLKWEGFLQFPKLCAWEDKRK
jgi:hypothetical protein